jgi:hypothetical protein
MYIHTGHHSSEFCFFQSISIELQVSDPEELEFDYVLEEVKKAGGANYGTGSPK